MVRRGDIWITALDPTVGGEIRKTRPCVIISPPEMHDFLRTAIVAPMTTGARPGPYRIPISFNDQPGLILIDQMRAVDKRRLTRRIGAIPMETLNLLLTTLQATFAD